jgi:hypothetical protein
MLEPVHGLAAERFLHGDVGHSSVDIARASAGRKLDRPRDLFDRAAFALGQCRPAVTISVRLSG